MADSVDVYIRRGAYNSPGRAVLPILHGAAFSHAGSCKVIHRANIWRGWFCGEVLIAAILALQDRGGASLCIMLDANFREPCLGEVG